MKEIEPLQLADLQPVDVVMSHSSKIVWHLQMYQSFSFTQGDGFGGNANLDNTNDVLNPYENFFGEVPAIAPMEEDLHPVEPGIYISLIICIFAYNALCSLGPGTPGRPSLTRSNSKRGHDNSSEYSGTPSKRRPPFDV